MDIELRTGARPVEGYTLIERLGRGGFGEVWKATGPGGFLVALKFVPLDGNVGAVELRALEVIKTIRHPHLLANFGAWQQDGALIIAMELADRTLLDRFREAAGQGFTGIPAPEIFEHFLDAARALDYLNEPRHPGGGSGPLGIQHRDIKPQNLLLVGGSVKVADFGLARVLENSTTGHTGSMTPSYAAPEFFDHKTSSQSDQYSLAITYCHLRGGRLPFEGNPAAVIAGHVMREPDLSMIPEIERPAVARALAKSPRDRWPSCRAFVQAVMDAEGVNAPPTVEPDDPSWRRRTTVPEPGPTVPPPKPERLSELAPAIPDSPSSPRWLYLAATTLVAVGIIMFLGFVRVSRRPSEPASGSAIAKPASPDPGSLEVVLSHIAKGMELVGKEENEQAIAEFDEAIRLDPSRPAAFAGRAFARALLPDRAGGRGPSMKKQQSKQAIALRESRRQHSKDDSDTALRLDPNLPLGHSARGLMLTMGSTPDFAAALDECDKAIGFGSGNALVSLAKAHVLFRRAFQDNHGSDDARSADLRVASKVAGRAIHLDTRLVAAYYLRGNARRMTENEDGALDDYAEAQRLDPGKPTGSFLSGLIWQSKGDNASALRHFNAALKIAPDMAPAYYKRAEVYEAMGDKARAEADRREAARIAGRSPEGGLRKDATNK